MPTPITLETIRSAPKVLLHDHLDGGLRAGTVIELAHEYGYEDLPTTDVAELSEWFIGSADSGSLVRYLETFAHTVGVMQTREALIRVASECAPELHVTQGLKLEEVVQAVLDGFAAGSRAAEANGTPIVVRALLTAMRHAA